MKSLSILGVKVNIIGGGKDLREVFLRLVSKGNSKIYTINPEFIVDSYFDPKFKDTLNKGDLNTIDGFGVALKVQHLLNQEAELGILEFIKNYFQGKIQSLVFTGVDLTEELLKIANREGMSVFLLGGSKELEVSYKAYKVLNNRFPKIKFIGYSSDFSYSPSDDKQTIKFIHNKMKEASCKRIDLLLVGYGHKKQEFWIERNISQIPANVAVGVGGTLDFLSGVVSRAPKWMRARGIEWLFRLFIQPRRLLRIFKATFVYLFLIIFFAQKKRQKRN